MCRAVEPCTWDRNVGCQPSSGAMKRVKGVAHFGPAPNHHHRGPSIPPPPPPPPPFAGGPGGPPVPAFVCRSTTSPVACMHMNGCRLNGNGSCDGAFAYDYEEFDSGDFEFEASPDDVDSADYDYDEEFDEEYYDEDEEDADIDMMDA